MEPSQAGGNLLGKELLKGAAKGLYNLGRIGASKAIKSNLAKQKIKGMADKYLDQALDSFTSDLSKNLIRFIKVVVLISIMPFSRLHPKMVL